MSSSPNSSLNGSTGSSSEALPEGARRASVERASGAVRVVPYCHGSRKAS
jgi:hypothetical protein